MKSIKEQVVYCKIGMNSFLMLEQNLVMRLSIFLQSAQESDYFITMILMDL
jgi:hypothetical protein